MDGNDARLPSLWTCHECTHPLFCPVSRHTRVAHQSKQSTLVTQRAALSGASGYCISYSHASKRPLCPNALSFGPSYCFMPPYVWVLSLPLLLVRTRRNSALEDPISSSGRDTLSMERRYEHGLGNPGSGPATPGNNSQRGEKRSHTCVIRSLCQHLE